MASPHATRRISPRAASLPPPAARACVAISNHDTPETRALYREADECYELVVPRRISCHGDNRHAARELLAVFRPADAESQDNRESGAGRPER